MLSLRHQGSQDPYYAPARDIAYLYPAACQAVAGMLEDGKDAAIRKWCEQHKVGVGNLAEAMAAYCRFLNLAHQDPAETLEEAMTRSGWFDRPQAAQFAVLYYMGTVMTATFFQGIRDVMRLNEEPMDSIKHLMWAAQRALLYSRMSRWQRFAYRWCKPWRRLLWKMYRINKPGRRG
jgi:hypothetical protein